MTRKNWYWFDLFRTRHNLLEGNCRKDLFPQKFNVKLLFELSPGNQFEQGILDFKNRFRNIRIYSVECHLRPPSTPSPSPPSPSTPPTPRAPYYSSTLLLIFFFPEGCWLFERSPPCWSCPVVSSWLLVFSFASSQQFFPKLIPKPKKEKTMLRVFPE